MKKIAIIFISFLIGITSVYAESYDNGDYSLPIGSIQIYTGNDIPSNYMLANGQELSRTKYENLYSIIGNYYGSGDGTTTFNLPNLAGRVAVGISDNDSSFGSLGSKGGTKTETITNNQMPSHTHIFSSSAHTHTFTGNSVTTSSAGAHGHTITGSATSAGSHTHSLYTGFGHKWTTVNVDSFLTDATTAVAYRAYALGNAQFISNAANHGHSVATSSVGSAGTHNHTFKATGSLSSTKINGTNAAIGGGEAHNNLQPYITLNYMIKVA